MGPCDLHFEDSIDLHFGDTTAHATVEWFLSQLFSDNSLTDHSDELYKDLTAVRFVDCLRQKVKGNKEYFERISKYYAEKLEQGKIWKDFPNLSVFLLSIARNNKSVKNTPLYRVGEQLYEYFKEHPDSHSDSYAFVLEVGIQLARFQEDDEWQREFAKFKALHYEKLNKLRMHYYSVEDNPAAFTLRAVKRWINLNSSNIQKSEEFHPKFKKHAEDLKELDPESNILHPLCLELPISARSSEVLKFANRFIQELEDEKKDIDKKKDIVEELAKKFRIFQWVVLVRNLVEEHDPDKKHTLRFHPIIGSNNIPGMVGSDNINGMSDSLIEGLLIDFINEARSVEWLFKPKDGEIPTEQLFDNHSTEEFFPKCSIPSIKKKVKECHDSFKILLPKVIDFHASVHTDLVRAFAKIRNEGDTSSTMLIEDGELTFFSLLWLLRSAASRQESQIQTKCEENLFVRFRPNEDDSPGEWWSQCNMYEFAEELGLIICLTNEYCILTRRWRSIVAWVNRYVQILSEDDGGKKLTQKLPVKMLDYKENEEKSFLSQLKYFFKNLRDEKLNDELNIFSSNTFRSCKDFSKIFGDLIKLLEQLINQTYSGGLEDTVLLRCCRAGFIPLEHLFRAYQPYESHLLIQALNWEESSHRDWGRSPISLGFATIAGRVERDPKLLDASETGQDPPTSNFDDWLVPYRTLFSTLSAGISLPAVQQSSEQIGEQAGKITQKHYFAHQTSGLLNTVWSDKNRSQLSFESNFSLWMAKTQVTEIWGGFRIDTREKIHEDRDFNSFSQRMEVDWKKLDGRGIVEKLVYLGLHGGIRRALQSSNRPFARNIATNIFAPLNSSSDQPKKVKQILGDVLDSLSFSLPEDEPPIWVDTKAFSLCFYHGIRQAAYHALETSFDDNDEDSPKKPCLGVVWKDQRVFIGNRGEVDSEEHLAPRFETTDREYFHLFEKNTEKEFKTEGPKPVLVDDAIWEDKWEDEIIWQLMITKENYNEFQV